MARTASRVMTAASVQRDVDRRYGRKLTEFRQPIQVQSHLEMPGILVQLGCIQRT